MLSRFLPVFLIVLILLLLGNGARATGSTEELPGLEVTQEISMGYLAPEDPTEFHNFDFVADDVVFFDVASNSIMAEGKDALIPALTYIYTIAFDAFTEDFAITFGNGRAVLEWTIVGKHIGEFAGIPATGREIRVPMIAVYELDPAPPSPDNKCPGIHDVKYSYGSTDQLNQSELKLGLETGNNFPGGNSRGFWAIFRN